MKAIHLITLLETIDRGHGDNKVDPDNTIDRDNGAWIEVMLSIQIKVWKVMEEMKSRRA